MQGPFIFELQIIVEEYLSILLYKLAIYLNYFNLQDDWLIFTINSFYKNSYFTES